MSDRTIVSTQQLAEWIDDGVVDTVIAAIVDHQGRLMGKRVAARHYLDHVAGHGFEACDYLLATDVDMVPLPGFAFASYEQGYGDLRAVPDPRTVRRVPWLEATAMVLCDVVDADGNPVAVSPRQVLRQQVERAGTHGVAPLHGVELEFFLFRDGYGAIHERGYRDLRPAGDFNQDYCIGQTTRDEWLIGLIRRQMDGAGIPVEYSKGEAEIGQHEINLRYADALETADRSVIYKNGVKEIADLHGHAITFMAKYDAARVGSSGHIHSSWTDRDGASKFHDPDAADGMSDTMRWYLGGLLSTAREFSLLYAPTVNSYKRFQPGSWAPTAIAWGRDNRTLGFRVVGRGASLRVENRIPGADINPYLAFAATIAGGIHGVDHRIEPPPPTSGNGYQAAGLPRVPVTLAEAIELWRHSEVAVTAFGEQVHAHVLNLAEHEWAAFNRHVTDWELRRNFRRL